MTVHLLGSTAVADVALTIPIDAGVAAKNGDITINQIFSIDTGTVTDPTTTFTFPPDGMKYTGRIVTQMGGPSIVVYDFNTFNLTSMLSITGADPIAFLALNKNNAPFGINVSGKLNADGISGGAAAAGGPGGGNGGAEKKAGSSAAGTMTGAGGTGGKPFGPGGGGFGGGGGAGASGGNGAANTKGGAGGGTYGTNGMAVLFGGGGGGGGLGGAGRNGAAGGGGGGGVLLESAGKIQISGIVSAKGGTGGGVAAEAVVSGGGGAGGGIIIQAGLGNAANNSVVITGMVTANGGNGGTSGGLQPIMPLDLPVKVRPWELTVYPCSHIRRRLRAT